MADEKTASPARAVRRSSFAGETFANLFGGNHRGSVSRSSNSETPNTANVNNSQQPTQQQPGPITTAAAQAQRRRLSLTTLGLSGSSNNTSPFGSYTARRESYGSSGNGDSIDESAIEEDLDASQTPYMPFGRRSSFGAKALRDVRTGGGITPPGQNGGQTSASTSTITSASSNVPKAANGTISARDSKGRGHEGFNWSENFRSRAERASSIAGGAQAGVGGAAGNSSSPRPSHGRSQSVAIMEPAPVRELSKPKEQVRPDHFQERILKGDFYMD